MEAKLIVINGKANKNEVALNLPSTIGRSQEADLTIGHPMVSRQHCELFENDGLLMIRDLGSLNGTFVNGQRITETQLDPQTEVTVGPLTFRVDYERAGAGPGASDNVVMESLGETDEGAEQPEFAPVDESHPPEMPTVPLEEHDDQLISDTADFSGLLEAPAEPGARGKEDHEATDFFDQVDAGSPPPMPSSAGAFDVEEEESDPTPPPPAAQVTRPARSKPGVKPEESKALRKAAQEPVVEAAEEAEVEIEGEEERQEPVLEEVGEQDTDDPPAAKRDAKPAAAKKSWWPFGGGKAKGEKKPQKPVKKPAKAAPPVKAAPKPAPAAKAQPAPPTRREAAAEDLAFEALQDEDSPPDGDDESLDFLGDQK
jgi:pSer/pThr/pTyr-binding forkhead associated (FHA) protein